MPRWEDQEPFLCKQAKDALKKNYFIQKKHDYRKVGKFPKKQKKL